ncbi:MAG: hypothetical protein QXR71_04540 [Candidatus Aenigmatarchaeota archaeon]
MEAFKKLNLIIFLLLAISFSIAQENFAIIATDISYADYAIASVAAAKIGAKVYFAQGTEVSNETINQMIQDAVVTVYIIGGPVVVSENSENLLKQNFAKVYRIFGMTRFGTSIEVAKFFWPEGSEKVVITWDLPDHPIGKANETTARFVTKAAEFASHKKIPLLLIPKDETFPSEELTEALKFLGTKKVYYLAFGAKPINLNITTIEHKTEKEVEEENLREIKEKPIVIAAVANWQDGVATRATPHGTSILVFSENEIPNVVSKINILLATTNVSKILVTGKPDLAKKIYDALIEAGIGNKTKVILASGMHFEITKKISKEIKEDIEKIREEERRMRGRVEAMKELRKECIKLAFEINETRERIKDGEFETRIYPVASEMIRKCVQATNIEDIRGIVAEVNNQIKKFKWRKGLAGEEIVRETISERDMPKIISKKINVTPEIVEDIIMCKKKIIEISTEEEIEKKPTIEEKREIVEKCGPILKIPVSTVVSPMVPKKIATWNNTTTSPIGNTTGSPIGTPVAWNNTTTSPI